MDSIVLERLIFDLIDEPIKRGISTEDIARIIATAIYADIDRLREEAKREGSQRVEKYNVAQSSLF